MLSHGKHDLPKSHLSVSLSLFVLKDAINNRMLMLDGMPAVRVKAEPLESERGVRKLLPIYNTLHHFFLYVYPVCHTHKTNVLFSL